MNTVNKTTNFIRQTFINGIIFLVPVVALAWIFSGAISGMVSLFGGMQKNETVKKMGGPLFLLLLVIIGIVAIIFITGILIHFTFLRKFNDWLENRVLGMVPGYELYKTMMEEKLHIKHGEGKPVLVQWAESQQLGVQIEEHSNDTCTVYFPHASLTGGGTVQIVAKKLITVLDMPLNEMDDVMNKSGKGMGKYYNTK
ncbi:MAG: hypothetical protein ABJB86_20350 [Bacteroidota bacterium]